MRLLLLGATGRTGRTVLELALERGHEVAALVISPEKITSRSARLAVTSGDPCDQEAVATAVRGCDGVISALGPRSLSKKASEVYTQSARAILHGMRAAAVRRLVIVSAALLFPGLGARAAILRLILRRSLDAARGMEASIQASDLDWTIARPGQLTDRRPAGYRIASGTMPKSPRPISRADLAHYLVHEIEHGEHKREIVGLSGGQS
jgi:putative NADH-flavin reductase